MNVQEYLESTRLLQLLFYFCLFVSGSDFEEKEKGGCEKDEYGGGGILGGVWGKGVG
jgi:hypothetical protein